MIHAMPPIVTSLAGTGMDYYQGHIRETGPHTIRYQWIAHTSAQEHDRYVTRKLVLWLKLQPHTAKSYVSDSTYVPCQLRPTLKGVHIQIPGTKLNRAWGCSVLFPGDHGLFGGKPGKKLSEDSTDKANKFFKTFDWSNGGNPEKYNWKNWGNTREEAYTSISTSGKCKLCGMYWGSHSGFVCPAYDEHIA